MIDAVKAEASHIPVSFLCWHFAVSRSSFYQWRSGKKPARFVRKEELYKAIKEIFRASKKTYGSPRMYEELKAQSYQVSENTVAKYMAELGLDARLKKRFRVQTTDSNHSYPIADRLLKVEDHHTLPKAPGEILAGDITYIKLGGGFLYLAVVLDLFTREVVGWSISTSLRTQIVLEALSSAMARVGPDAEIIFHSDRGSQYASEAYRKFCKSKGVIPSMSRRGNCYDNSYVESWFSSLKKERLYRVKYRTENELRAIVFEYIEVWYNRKRRHSALGNRSPLSFRESHSAAR